MALAAARRIRTATAPGLEDGTAVAHQGVASLPRGDALVSRWTACWPASPVMTPEQSQWLASRTRALAGTGHRHRRLHGPLAVDDAIAAFDSARDRLANSPMDQQRAEPSLPSAVTCWSAARASTTAISTPCSTPREPAGTVAGSRSRAQRPLDHPPRARRRLVALRPARRECVLDLDDTHTLVRRRSPTTSPHATVDRPKPGRGGYSQGEGNIQSIVVVSQPLDDASRLNPRRPSR